MSWPLSQDYNEAIQSPATTFTDPELRKGEAVCNALGIPMPRSGTFADVYEVRCPGGGRWAVKCFTREVPGLRERYHAISQALQEAKLPFTVEFTYQQEGMRIRGRHFPILKMQWVEGLALNDFVRQNLDKPAMLEGLLAVWVRMAGRLRAARIAHADLQHGNVLLVPGSTANALALKLIDYDGMFVPALAGRPPGEMGHPAYQHPQRQRQRVYSTEVDRFPLLLIAAALRAVQAGRALWGRYDNGDNLLFREADLTAPDNSPLFRELFGLAGARALVGMVRRSLAGPLERVPLLEEALPELAAPLAVPVAVARAPAARPTPAAPVRTATLARPVAGATKTAPIPRAVVVVGPLPSGARPPEKKRARWLGVALAVGLLFLVGAAAVVFALNSGAKQTRAEETRTTAAPDKDRKSTPAAEVQAPGPGDSPASAPTREPRPTPADPVPPVARPAGGVLRLRHVLAGRTPIRSLAVSADGTLGLSADSAGTLRRWDLDTAVATHEARSGYGVVPGLAFVPGDRGFLFAAEGMTHLWDVERSEDENRLEKEWAWEPLFNGQDLTGWKTHPDSQTRWRVEAGQLVGQGPAGALFSQRDDYRNFVYRIEAKISDGGVAGQMFRTQFALSFPPGYEARINSNHGNPERTGSLHGLVRVPAPLHKPDEWFTQEVTAFGDHIRITVNGRTVVDTEDRKYARGHLALLQPDPKSVLTIRKIEIRELPEYSLHDLEVSADGSVALAACSDRLLAWNLGTNQPLRGRWPMLDNGLEVIRLAGAGRRAVSLDTARHAAVWDVATGSVALALDTDADPVRCIALAADGRLAVTGTEGGRVLLHDLEKKRVAFRELPNLGVPIQALALSPDRRYAVVAGAEVDPPRPFLVVFDLASGKEVQRLEDVPVAPNLLKFAAWAPRLLAGAEDGKLRVFEIAEPPTPDLAVLPGVRLRHLAALPPDPAPPTVLGATPDRKLVLLNAKGTLQVRDPEQGLQLLAEYPDPRMPTEVVGAIRGGSALVATPRGVHAVDLATSKRQVVDETPDRLVRFVELSEDGRLALVCSRAGRGEVLVVRDLARNTVIRETQVPPGLVLHAARFVPGGPYVALSDNEHSLRLLNVRTGMVDREFSAGPGGARGLAITPDGRRVVTAGIDGAVRVWDLANGSERYHFDGVPGLVPSAEVSPDGRVGLALFGTGPNAVLLFWDLASGRPLGSVAGDASFCPRLCRFASPGTLVVATTDGRTSVKAIEFDPQ